MLRLQHFYNIFTTNHRWLVVIVSNLNLTDKGNSVILIRSSILGQSDGPSELVSLTCTFITQQQ